MSIVLLILSFILISLWQIPSLLTEKSYKELVAFSVFMFIGFALALLQILGVNLPKPTTGIEFFVRQLTSVRFDYQPF